METTQPDTQPQIPQQPQPEPVTEPTTNWKRFVLDILETLVLAVVLYFGINAVSARVRVDGFSMRPTLQDGEYILVNKLAYKTGEPQRGDIVVFVFPVNPQEDLIKRVIGLPGETVSVQNGGSVCQWQRSWTEPYIASPPAYNGDWVVPEGKLFVLGDNRNDSRDSHQWGLTAHRKRDRQGRIDLLAAGRMAGDPASKRGLHSTVCDAGSVECSMNEQS